MCRFIAYLGNDILLETILLKPSNSLLAQSIHALESQMTTNGDGFGISWYTPSINDEPALFTSILPAWNDRNLLSLTKNIQSPCFFAHVRAANQGGISPYNCHPFCYQQLTFMHNGIVGNFKAVQRHIRQLLDDDIYQMLEGSTDSEHVFALFLQYAKQHPAPLTTKAMGETLIATIRHVLQLVKLYGNDEPSFLNLCVSNGKNLVASRYISHSNLTARSLYYAKGGEFTHTVGPCQLNPHGDKQCVLIASEKLTKAAVSWNEIARNQLICVDEAHQITLRPILI